jgi:Icc-related predicted phosphoesterase
VKILSVSDVEIGFIYSPRVVDRFRDVDLIVSCGDISYYYLEYIVSMLDVPMYYVLGNHANQVEDGVGGPRDEPWGIHDMPDRPHQGFRAFRWLIGAFHPAVHLHGHIHVYNASTVVETLIGTTRVINTYGYRVTSLEPQGRPMRRGSAKTHVS